MSAGNKLFVGNLAWSTDTNSLTQAFNQYGEVVDAIVMQDRETGRSRGFGFITFSNQDQAQAAIDALNEADVDGRNIRVNFATSQGGGGGGGGGGGRGGYRGGGGGGGGYGGNQGGYGGGHQGGYGGQQDNGYGGGGGYAGNGQQGGWRQGGNQGGGGGGGGGW
ncbi:uncharacterized protein MELLADRAFT_71659 [Melampsora larici-populina 98AG31]|uniref:RRM domain-containing protein n=1 Tax=Melampsora larici-populina (strain 98AG31 / pathotype 3-4-7) TaxID=747676 RepID=F4RJ48_MELLP|nr:uncharacterized protein MELLADRAFT_71659 [Melampsora larici-populina 98AG31]EGG07671.1 hypothetical protein MELLADRAFT_71659 [Melampsora larici-populina 98AG31]